jgi:hypothetical protein
VSSPPTLSEADRRIVAVWAADCAERVLRLFEAEAPGDSRPRDAIARTRAFARGELGVAGEFAPRRSPVRVRLAPSESSCKANAFRHDTCTSWQLLVTLLVKFWSS